MSIFKGKDKLFLLVSTIFIFVVVFFIYANFDFLPTSTDSVRIMIGAEEIKDDGELHKNIYENGGYTPYEKDTNFIYPQFQILIFTLSQIAGVEFHIMTTLISVILCCLIFCSFYLLVKNTADTSKKIAIVSSFFLFFSLTIGRSILLTPQNLFGYLFIILSLLFLFRYFKTKRALDLIVFGFFLIGLFHFHHLSFFLYLLILFFFIPFQLKGKWSWIYIGGSIILAGFGFFFLRFVLNQTYLIDEFKNAVVLGKGDNANSIFDLPAQIGYILFLLMAWGALKIKDLKPSVKNFVIVSSLVVFALSYLHYLGIYYFPDRMILFFIIPAVFLVPLALKSILHDLKKPLLMVFITLMFIAQIFHFTDFLRSDTEQFTDTFIPDFEVMAAFNFLNINSSEDDTVLSTFYGKNRSSIYLPYYFKGRTALWYLDDLTTLPSNRKSEGIDTWLSRIFSDGLDQEQLRIDDPNDHLYLMAMEPSGDGAKLLFNEYDVKYVMLFKDTEPWRLYQKSGMPAVFENSGITIFQNEK